MIFKGLLIAKNCLRPESAPLIQNLSESGGTGKVRNYWEQQVHVIVLSVGKNPVVYKVRPKYGPNCKSRILYRNRLMYCDDLMDNYKRVTSPT